MIEILTIGHSNHDIQGFLTIIKRHAIQLLVDVRSDPYSRYAPQFNKAEFQHSVAAAGIEYRYSGAQLGGKPKDPALYTQSGKPDYDRLATTNQFKSELEILIQLAQTRRVAVMCSEADPLGCHRERILAQTLRSRGIEVRHILPDGTLETVPQEGLF